MQLFVPGADPWDLPLVSDAAELGTLTPDPALIPALATRADHDRSLLYAGPVRVVLYGPTTEAVTRTLALGSDHGDALGHLSPDLPRIQVDHDGIAEALDAAGQPLTRCHTGPCPEPEGTDRWQPGFVGDGGAVRGGPDRSARRRC